MRQDFRQFSVTDPFGRTWATEFRWLQNAISIRHADTVDCKYYLSNGEEKFERVVALPHALLNEVATRQGREVNDAWCLQIAGLHIEHMISTWEDMDKAIVTVPRVELERHAAAIAAAAGERRRHAALAR
jgi:hypothetical protein